MENVKFAWLELTEKCNLSCKHCYVSSSPLKKLNSKLETQDWLQIIQELKSLDCNGIQFIGGEPFLHPDIYDLIKEAVRQEFQTIEIFSNLTLDNKINWELLRNNKISLATSFYSHERAVHNSIVNEDYGYEKTLLNIQRAIAQEIEIRVEIIDVGENSKEIPNTIYFLKKLGVKQIGFSHSQANGRNKELKSNTSSLKDDLCGQCWKDKLCFTNSGKVYPCIMARSYELGNYSLTKSVSSILKSNAISETRRFIKDSFNKQDSSFMYLRPNTLSLNPLNRCGPDVFDTCGPQNCSPYDCSPSGVTCGPDNCSPQDCSPSGVTCGPHNCSPYDSSFCGPSMIQDCSPNLTTDFCGPTIIDGIGGNCGPAVINPGNDGLINPGRDNT